MQLNRPIHCWSFFWVPWVATVFGSGGAAPVLGSSGGTEVKGSDVGVGLLEYSRGAIYRGRYTASRAALGVLKILRSAIYRGRYTASRTPLCWSNYFGVWCRGGRDRFFENDMIQYKKCTGKWKERKNLRQEMGGKWKPYKTILKSGNKLKWETILYKEHHFLTQNKKNKGKIGTIR